MMRSQNSLLHPLDWASDLHVRVAEMTFDLCLCYFTGLGTARSSKKGLDWLAFAALLGNDIAMSLYQPCEDSIEAHRTDLLPRRAWLLLSCLKGFQESGACLKRGFPEDMASIKAIMGSRDTFDWDFNDFSTPQDAISSQQAIFHRFNVPGFSVSMPLLTDCSVQQGLIHREGGMARSLPLPEYRWRVSVRGSFVTQQDIVGKEYQVVLTSIMLLDSDTFIEHFPMLLSYTEINVNEIFIATLLNYDSFFLNLRWSYGALFATKQANMIRALLRCGLDPIRHMPESPPVLSLAVVEGYVEMAAEMVEHVRQGAFDINEFFEDPRYWMGRTAIHRCVSRKQIYMLRYLLEKRLCDINLRRDSGTTALHVAAMERDPVWAKTLLEHGADCLIRNDTRDLPFDLALACGNLDVADLLLPQGKSQSALGPHEQSGFTSFGKILSAALTGYRGITPLDSFHFLKKVGAVEYIINNKTGSSAYHLFFLFDPQQRKDYAAYDRALLEFLIACFPKPSELEYPDIIYGMRPLHLAVFLCNYDAVYLLLEAGSAINAETTIPLVQSGACAPPGLTALNIAMHRRSRPKQHMYSAGAREIQDSMRSCDKIVQLLREKGAKSGSGSSAFDDLEILYPDTIHISYLPFRDRLDKMEGYFWQMIGAIEGEASRNANMDRKRRYMGNWPEEYKQSPLHLRADMLSEAMQFIFQEEIRKYARDLPPWWETRRAESGRLYYVNHETKTTTWEDPGHAFKLLRCAEKGEVESARSCLKRPGGYDVNVVDHLGRSALLIAAEFGHRDFITMLLGQRVDSITLDYVNEQGQDAAQVAASMEHGEIATIIRQAKLHQAATQGQATKITELLSKGSNVDYHIATVGSALHAAVYHGRINSVRLLVDSGASIDLIAVAGAVSLQKEGVDKAIVNYLLDEKRFKVDSNSPDFVEVIDRLIERSGLSTLQWLVHSGANFKAYHHPNGQNPLHVAARKGHLMITRFLVSNGVNAKSRDIHGVLPIHYAARYGHTEIMKELENLGSAAVDLYGRNILHHAAMSGSADTVDVALTMIRGCGADPNAIDIDAWTPLHWAARQGSTNVIQKLLDAGGQSTKEYLCQWKPSDVADAHRQLMAYLELIPAELKYFGQNNPLSEKRVKQLLRYMIYPAVGDACRGCALVSYIPTVVLRPRPAVPDRSTGTQY